MRLSRPYMLSSGRITYVSLDVCRCEDRRGPPHGVCGCCGGAIPDDAEQKRLKNDPELLKEGL